MRNAWRLASPMVLLLINILASRPVALHAATEALNTPPSRLEVGCLAPCTCPVVSSPTYGSFELVPAGADAQYAYYSVQNYIASFNNGPGAVSITGSGSYRISTGSSPQQEMTLDLQVWGGPPQRFDSGLQAVPVAFPAIHVACAVHAFTCDDSVLTVDARPVDAAAVTGTPSRTGITAALPNPLARRIRIDFQLARADRVLLDVLDLQGRRVRNLRDGWDGPGTRSISWDARDDQGKLVTPGIYWLRMRWSGGVDGRRIVRLD